MTRNIQQVPRYKNEQNGGYAAPLIKVARDILRKEVLLKIFFSKVKAEINIHLTFLEK